LVRAHRPEGDAQAFRKSAPGSKWMHEAFRTNVPPQTNPPPARASVNAPPQRRWGANDVQKQRSERFKKRAAA